MKLWKGEESSEKNNRMIVLRTAFFTSAALWNFTLTNPATQENAKNV
jgi:hypothetical protein